ncbi:MAG: pyridoxal 5'-phosphate synthase glutaminase subunit PdxT [Armatimonadota bacterium]|nr:pyridoxal 5'-phosphate synthase glutaminase subunit PdxT [Armatimonadota bacterium]
MRVGVLALQGDVSEHAEALRQAGAESVLVRTPQALEDVQALVLPGGESTTLGALMARCGLDQAIRRRAQEGMPLFGTCAGLILMASRAAGGEPALLGVMDVTVERNAYGRQRESFEDDLHCPAVDPSPFRVAFIRAPVVTWVGDGVEVLARHEGLPVLVRQGHLLGATFHPEVTGYAGVHRYFCGMLPPEQADGRP